MIHIYKPIAFTHQKSPFLNIEDGTARVPARYVTNRYSEIEFEHNPFAELREQLFDEIKTTTTPTVPNVVAAINSGKHEGLVLKIKAIGDLTPLMHILPRECFEAIRNYAPKSPNV